MFTQGAKAEEALAAGADIVGFDDLAAKVKAGELDFDVVIASPDAMRVVGQLGQILGPRGLMPNPKVGTVTPNVAQAVKNAKAGQVQFRADKAGIIHAPIGRASFTADRLQSRLPRRASTSARLPSPPRWASVFALISVLSTTNEPNITGSVLRWSGQPDQDAAKAARPEKRNLFSRP